MSDSDSTFTLCPVCPAKGDRAHPSEEFTGAKRYVRALFALNNHTSSEHNKPSMMTANDGTVSSLCPRCGEAGSAKTDDDRGRQSALFSLDYHSNEAHARPVLFTVLPN